MMEDQRIPYDDRTSRSVHHTMSMEAKAKPLDASMNDRHVLLRSLDLGTVERITVL